MRLPNKCISCVLINNSVNIKQRMGIRKREIEVQSLQECQEGYVLKQNTTPKYDPTVERFQVGRL